MPPTTLQLIREVSGDTVYEYYPIGHYIVAAPSVCGGRPTFKYTRLEVATILDLLAAGWTVECLVQEYAQSHLTPEAIAEAMQPLHWASIVLSSPSHTTGVALGVPPSRNHSCQEPGRLI